MCENIVMDGEIAILWRVIDTFSYDLRLPESVPKDVLDELNVNLACQLFTRWGPPGKGEFEEQLGLIAPDGVEVKRDEPRAFNISGGSFQQTVWNIQLGVRNPGSYNWVIYLNGKEFARLPFTVNINRQPMQAQ
jgi:hypothetical protein